LKNDVQKNKKKIGQKGRLTRQTEIKGPFGTLKNWGQDFVRHEQQQSKNGGKMELFLQSLSGKMGALIPLLPARGERQLAIHADNATTHTA
jgi:hypothetical protein